MMRILATILLILLLCSCSTSKRSKSSREEVLKIEQTKTAKDSAVAVYSVDTTRECLQYIDFERIEYYDKTDAEGRQLVKAVVHRRAGKAEKSAGVTEAKVGRVTSDTARAVVDTYKASRLEEEKTERRRAAWWWLLGVLVAVAFSLWYYGKK